MRERFDRIEDAVCAVRAAREEGVVLGGGLTLANLDAADTGKIEFDFGDQASDLDLTDDFLSVLKHPAELLGTINESKSTLAAAGVYEPFLVVKTVLENAISTAALVLTTDVAILNMSNFYNN
jgi:chaperonin GroEL